MKRRVQSYWARPDATTQNHKWNESFGNWIPHPPPGYFGLSASSAPIYTGKITMLIYKA